MPLNPAFLSGIFNASEPNPWPAAKEVLNKSAMSHVVNINGMIARRTTQVVVILRSQGVQRSKRPFMLQPMRALALRAVCCVRLLTKGMAIVVSSPFLHPIPQSRVRGHVGLVQGFPKSM